MLNQTVASFGSHPEMSNNDFRRLSSLIYAKCGINLPDSKSVLIEGRIRKRIKKLGLQNFEEYFNYLFSEKGLADELIPVIDVVTTNKTDFYREAQHFDFLTQKAIPALMTAKEKNGREQKISIWSSACSTGEEPYTLAIVLSEYFQNYNSNPFTIYASDISTEVLKKAQLGVFTLDDIEVIDMSLKKKYFLKSKDAASRQVRVVPSLRTQINFERINLIDEKYDLPCKMDVIFCRNVIIYFDKPTQQKVLMNLSNHLLPGGFLFLGHSETIVGTNLPLNRIVSTVYQKQGG